MFIWNILVHRIHPWIQLKQFSQLILQINSDDTTMDADMEVS